MTSVVYLRDRLRGAQRGPADFHEFREAFRVALLDE